MVVVVDVGTDPVVAVVEPVETVEPVDVPVVDAAGALGELGDVTVPALTDEDPLTPVVAGACAGACLEVSSAEARLTRDEVASMVALTTRNF